MTNKSFNQWLAGLIDGKGSLLWSKKNYGSLEIIMNIKDERTLYIIKKIYGGSIKIRAGSNSIRYRLKSKLDLIKLINNINGEIRNPKRLLELSKLCSKYNIELKYPEELTYENGWLSGIFDSVGEIKINEPGSETGERSYLSISITHNTLDILKPLINLYNGSIYIDNYKYNSYKWEIKTKNDIINILNYFELNRSRTLKWNRVQLINKYYDINEKYNIEKGINITLEKIKQQFYKDW